MKIAFYTLLALVAFAGNSILCRLALGNEQIDAASFAAIRLLSGVAFLLLIFKFSNQKEQPESKGSWVSALMLFVYAITFSYAYISLETGIGALILFASVQFTMVISSLFLGNKITALQWVGVTMAFLGFVYLVFPTLSTPSAKGFSLMLVAGIAWGFYTLLGSASKNPLSDTLYNFSKTLPLVLVLLFFTVSQASFSSKGILIAVIAGGITSGVGYAIWYSVLTEISAIKASVLQLSVPVISALGGALFSDEAITIRLVISTAIIISGILIVVLNKQTQAST